MIDHGYSTSLTRALHPPPISPPTSLSLFQREQRYGNKQPMSYFGMLSVEVCCAHDLVVAAH